jgi:hypothetical protein
MIFGVVFMVGFGIWHAPILEFASEALPTNLAETMTTISTNSTGVSNSGGGSNGVSEILPPLSSSFMLEHADRTIPR